jgi:hypothetical protein
MRNLIRFSVAVVVTIQLGCAHHQQKFDTELSEVRCEEALAHLPEKEPAIRFVDNAQVAGGALVSYSATGVAYAADVVAIVLGATAIFIVLCGPILVAMSAGGGGGSGPLCIPADLSGLKRPRMGEATFEATQSLRCPDITSASRSIRKVAACFANRKENDDLVKARTTLEGLANSPDFGDCASPEDKKAIEGEIQSLALRAL